MVECGRILWYNKVYFSKGAKCDEKGKNHGIKDHLR